MMTIHVNGAALDCVEQGTGDPLVLVHGSASDRRTWEAQLPELGRRFRTVAYSRRYHWPNDPIPEGADYSMQEHVDDLEAVLRSLDIAPAHLVGHSYGAFLCLLLAMRAPSLVRTLVLAEPPVLTLFVSGSPRLAEMLRLLVRRPRTAAAIAGFGATGIGPAAAAARRGDMDSAMRIFGRAVLGRARYDRLSAARRDQVMANAIPAELLGSGFASVDESAVRRVRAPALLMNGSGSPAIFHRINDRLDELLPHAARRTIAGASHILHEDDARAFNAAVLSFLEPAGRPGAAAATNSIRVGREDIASAVAAALIATLNAELAALYPEPGATHFRVDPDDVAEGRGAFLVAYADGRPVGCGAVRKLDADTAEIKRMYVESGLRGRGIGRSVLEGLEREARALGVRRIVLETGIRQGAAIALYERAGYAHVPPFGEYVASTGTSVCMAKELA